MDGRFSFFGGVERASCGHAGKWSRGAGGGLQASVSAAAFVETSGNQWNPFPRKLVRPLFWGSRGNEVIFTCVFQGRKTFA